MRITSSDVLILTGEEHAHIMVVVTFTLFRNECWQQARADMATKCGFIQRGTSATHETDAVLVSIAPPFPVLLFSLDYFTESLPDAGASGGADADFGESGIRTLFTDSVISLACASSWLTCQTSVSVSLVLKEGIPERRIPLTVFQ